MAGGNTIGRIVGQSPAKNSKPSAGNPLQQLMGLVQQAMSMVQQIQGLIKSFSGQGGGGGGGGGGAGGGAAGGGAAGGGASSLLGPLNQALGLATQLSGLHSSLAQALGGAGATGATPAAGAPAHDTATSPTTATTSTPTDLSAVDPARLRAVLDANPELAAQVTDARAALRDTLTRIGPTLTPTPASMEGAASPAQAQTRDIQDALHALTMNLSGPPGAAVEQSRLDAALPVAQQLASSAPTPAQGAQAVDNAMTSAAMGGASQPALAMLQKVLGQIQQVMGLVQQVMGMAQKLHGDGAQVKRKQ